MRQHAVSDYGGKEIIQSDSWNCGPIACVVMWRTFIPDEVDVSTNVEMFRSLVVTKMKALIEESKKAKKLLVSSKENVFIIGDDITDNEIFDKVEYDKIGQTDNAKDEKIELTSNHEISMENEDLSPAHRAKILNRVESDMKRKRYQDKQGNRMKSRYKKTIESSVGKIVTLSVDIRDRNSTIPRGIIGVIAKVSSSGSGNSAIMTSHGLLGSKN